MKKYNFLLYKDAQKITYKLGLKNLKEWKIYCKFGNKLANIPCNPNIVYKYEWNCYAEWLGTKNHRSKMQFLPYAEAQKKIHKLNLKNFQEYNKWHRQKKPANIPAHPNRTYRNKGWINLKDWLGNNDIKVRNKNFVDYQSGQKFAYKLEFKTHGQWIEYCKTGNKPQYIPAAPYKVYKNKGWKSWSHWLKNETNKFPSFEQALEILKKVN